MRWFFVLLLVANIGLFALMQLSQGKPGTEPMSDHAPANAEKIRLLSDQDTQREPLPALTQSAPALSCIEWGPLSDEDMTRARSALQALELGENDVNVRKSADKSSSFWVYVPPMKSKQDANKKVEELKRLGIQDSFVMQENNKWRYAVSLGVFSSEEGASKYLALLRGRGVKSAAMAPRGQDGAHARLMLTLRKENQGAAVAKLVLDYPGSELKAVSCSQ